MMRKNQLLATALGMALVAGPALAQQSDMPMRAPYQPGMGQTGAAGGGMMSGQADDMGRPAAARMVEQASAALRQGHVAQANDLLEQAETRLLTRSTPASMAGQPMRDPALDQLSAARSALQSRDRAGAMRQMDQALASLRSDSATGAGGMGAAPAQGGGMGGWGGPTMRDSGPAGQSMSRADAIIRVQAGGGGSGGLSGSSPGSPGVGNPGSTPRAMPGSTIQPGQGSASPGSAMGSGSSGVGAPPPGATAPMQGSGSGAMGSGSALVPGSTPSGGGTGSNPSR